MINNEIPIIDAEIENYLANNDLNLKATTDNYEAYKDAEYAVRAPTNYDPIKSILTQERWRQSLQRSLNKSMP